MAVPEKTYAQDPALGDPKIGDPGHPAFNPRPAGEERGDRTVAPGSRAGSAKPQVDLDEDDAKSVALGAVTGQPTLATKKVIEKSLKKIRGEEAETAAKVGEKYDPNKPSKREQVLLAMLAATEGDSSAPGRWVPPQFAHVGTTETIQGQQNVPEEALRALQGWGEKTADAIERSTQAQLQENAARQKASEEAARVEAEMESVRLENQASRAREVRNYMDQVQRALIEANQTIDPDSYFKKNSRVKMAIAVGLGAFGQAMTGAQNPALAIMKHGIDTEIAAQRMNQQGALQRAGAAQNMLTKFRDILGDEEAAERATRAFLLGQVQRGLDSQLRLSADQGAIAKGQAMAGELNREIAHELLALAKRMYGVRGVAHRHALQKGYMVGGSGGKKKGDEEKAHWLAEKVAPLEAADLALDEAIKAAEQLGDDEGGLFGAFGTAGIKMWSKGEEGRGFYEKVYKGKKSAAMQRIYGGYVAGLKSTAGKAMTNTEIDVEAAKTMGSGGKDNILHGLRQLKAEVDRKRQVYRQGDIGQARTLRRNQHSPEVGTVPTQRTTEGPAPRTGAPSAD